METVNRERTALYRTRKRLAAAFAIAVVAGTGYGLYRGVRHASQESALGIMVEHYETKAKEHESALAQLEKGRRELSKERATMGERVREEVKDEFEKAKSEYEAKIKTLEADHSKRIAELKTETTNHVEQTQAYYTERIRKIIENQTQRLQAARDKETTPIKQKLEEIEKRKQEYNAKVAEYAALVETMQSRISAVPETLTAMLDRSALTPLERELFLESHIGRQTLEKLMNQKGKFLDLTAHGQHIVGYTSEEPRRQANLFICIRNPATSAPLAAYNYAAAIERTYPSITSLFTNSVPDFGIVFGAEKEAEVIRYRDGNYAAYHGTTLMVKKDMPEVITAQQKRALRIRDELMQLYHMGAPVLSPNPIEQRE